MYPWGKEVSLLRYPSGVTGLGSPEIRHGHKQQPYAYKGRAHEIICILSTSRQDLILTYILKLSQSFLFFSIMSKFDYKNKNVSLMTYYFVKKANFKRSVHLGVVFNVWEKGKWASRVQPTCYRPVQLIGLSSTVNLHFKCNVSYNIRSRIPCQNTCMFLQEGSNV